MLTDVLICQLMNESNSLWLMLHGLAIDDCYSEVFDNSLVNGVTLQSC